jgi:hypothetical protein
MVVSLDEFVSCQAYLWSDFPVSVRNNKKYLGFLEVSYSLIVNIGITLYFN